MTLHQGDCVHLTSDEHLYQVIGVDDHQNRCWVRRWPMARHGSPVFEISLHLVDSQPNGGPSPSSFGLGSGLRPAEGPGPGPAHGDPVSPIAAHGLTHASQAGS